MGKYTERLRAADRELADALREEEDRGQRGSERGDQAIRDLGRAAAGQDPKGGR